MPIGVLCIAGSQTGDVDDDHAEIVGEVANQLAVAIHQATLREALDQQQRRLQELVEHLPEGVLLVERDGRIALTHPFARDHLAAVASLSPTVTSPTSATVAVPLLAAPVRPRDRGVGVVFQVATQRLDAAEGVVGDPHVTREREAQKAAGQARPSRSDSWRQGSRTTSTTS